MVIVVRLGFFEGIANQGRKALRLLIKSFVSYLDAAQRDEIVCGELECPEPVRPAQGPLVFQSIAVHMQHGHDCSQVGG